MFQNKLFNLKNPQVRNLILLAIILAVLCVFQLAKGGSVNTLQLEKDSLTLTDPSGEVSVVVQYGDIESVSEAASLDIGTFVSGTNTSSCRFGTWSNDAYGEYTLCVVPKIKDYIVMQTVHGVVVFNYESTDTTQHLYPAVLELVENYQGGDS